MKFNIDKCNVIHITNKRSNKIVYKYNLNGQILQETDTCTYLGINIQNDLKWNLHVANNIKKANSIIGLLRRNIGSCRADTKALAYQSLVRPVLEYATSAWDPHLKSHVNNIEMVQRRAARFVNSDYRQTSSVSPMLSSLKWPTLQSRRTL